MSAVPWFSKRLLHIDRLMLIMYIAVGVCLMQPTHFDRVNFCKLFQELMNRQLPPLVVRLLLNLYTKHVTHVTWNGVSSQIKFSETMSYYQSNFILY